MKHLEKLFTSSEKGFIILKIQLVMRITYLCSIVQTVYVVVVELPQAPEDDPQKRKSCAWKAVGLVTVGVCV